MIDNKLLKTIIIASSLLFPSLLASQPITTKFSSEEKDDIRRIETHLNGIKSLRADFLQVSSNGTMATGKLYMARPGRIRFEYDPPSPILLVSDGYFLRYVDKDLKQVTHLWLDNTPIGFLLDDEIKLNESITITKFSRNANVLIITLTNSEKPEKGIISLIFSDKPLKLKKWVIKDAQGITTTITLNNSERAIKINPILFELTSDEKNYK
ncbi:outer membrane lipoprotein carrier protein LolA [Gammaproteobacteria bacterium]|nr:outer membrane lipoprotein carrier protein LolA [Gammaproteobacteria bacterium]